MNDGLASSAITRRPAFALTSSGIHFNGGGSPSGLSLGNTLAPSSDSLAQHPARRPDRSREPCRR
ncbi:MAG: hypothetical protein AAB915_01665, partial [Patescibacteria group bacterium]